MTVCGGSWPSPQAFRQASPLHLLATSPAPFTRKNTQEAPGLLPLDHNRQHCEFTHVVCLCSQLTDCVFDFCTLSCMCLWYCHVCHCISGL